ncbi:MAG: DUF58 domain-containing protein [Acidimicrobiales bacterium]
MPTRRLGLVTLALAAVVLFVPARVNGLVVVNAALLLVVVADFLLAPAPGRIGVDRLFPDVVTLRATAGLAWRVTNPTSRRQRIGIADQLAPSLRARARRAEVEVPGDGSVTARTLIRPVRRGRFDLGELAVRTYGPLGLVGRQRTRRVRARLRIYPQFKSRAEAELRITKARILEVGMRSAQGRGGGTEFEQLREWTPDDEFRRVDWAATARTNKPIVRTYRAERNQTVIVLLDNGRVMAGQVAGVPRVEHAMDAAMAITTVATRLGDRCGLVAFDTEVRAVVPPAKHRNQLGRVTEAVYDLEPELAESDYLGAFTETLARFRRRALLVVLTELVEAAAREYLLPALPLIARSHVVLLGSVRDPEVVGWASEVPEDPSGVYRKAAAVGALDERARTIARLRGLGAVVIDAPPGRLAGRLADAYLEIKARGQL